MISPSTVEQRSDPSAPLGPRLAAGSLKMARLFADGATLWCVAPGRPDDARHVAVEFIHPVIVGKRALPAMAIVDAGPVARLARVVRDGDMVLCIGAGDDHHLAEICRQGGTETFWIGWGRRPTAANGVTLLWVADHQSDAAVVRAYHLLWELAHVCLEQRDVLGSADSGEAPAGNKTSFLYPFLEGGQRDPGQLLEELALSAEAKLDESRLLIERSLADNQPTLDAVTEAIVNRMDAGAELLTFGNGGSACDALGFVRRLDDHPKSQALDARSLADDPAVLTALSNDVGVDQIFSRQIEAFGRRGDIAVAFSTSGQSPNLLLALAAARKAGMLTVAFAGYHGGAMIENPDVDHCVVVRSESVHRIQEAQTHLASVLCWSIAAKAAQVEERP